MLFWLGKIASKNIKQLRINSRFFRLKMKS